MYTHSNAVLEYPLVYVLAGTIMGHTNSGMQQWLNGIPNGTAIQHGSAIGS